MATKPKLDPKELRGISLDVVFESFGAVRDSKDPSRNWKAPAGRFSTSENMFFNHTAEKGGAGAIDLAMALGDLSFQQALSHLAAISGMGATVSEYRADAQRRVEKIVKETPAPEKVKTEIPAAVPHRLDQVRKYLVETRGIDAEVVHGAISKGRVWADKFGNAVFALSDPGLSGERFGAELRGTYDKPFHGVRGEKKGLFFTGDVREKNAVFVESSIEALSYQTLAARGVEVNGEKLPVAMAVGIIGSSKQALLEVAGALEKRGFKLHAGFNNDKDGERYASWLGENFKDVQKLVPGNVKDWNRLLLETREREVVQSPAVARAPAKRMSGKEADIEPDR